MLPPEKFIKLVELLNRQTVEKKVDWKADGLTAWAKIGNNFVNLSPRRNTGGDPVEVVSISNVNAEVIETFDDEQLGNDRPSFSQFDSYWTMMRVTRETAVRQATGADDAVDDLLSALGLEDDTPF